MFKIRLFCLFILTCTIASAQNFEGVFVGSLFSEKNIVSIQTLKNALTGTVFINEREKIFFFGEIRGSEFTSTMNYAKKVWACKGNLVKDSLLLTLTSDGETKKSYLKKISSSPNKNIPKSRPAAQSDQRLTGEWILQKRENPDGSPKKMDEEMRGATYRFVSNGSLYIDFPNSPLRKKYPGFSPLVQKWSANGSILTIENKHKTSAVEYSIKSDTLILYPTSGKECLVKSKSRNKIE